MVRVLRSGSVVASMQKAHRTRVCEPEEEWEEGSVRLAFRACTRRRSCCELGQSEEYPTRYCNGRVSNVAPGILDVKRSAFRAGTRLEHQKLVIMPRMTDTKAMTP